VWPTGTTGSRAEEHAETNREPLEDVSNSLRIDRLVVPIIGRSHIGTVLGSIHKYWTRSELPAFHPFTSVFRRQQRFGTKQIGLEGRLLGLTVDILRQVWKVLEDLWAMVRGR